MPLGGACRWTPPVSTPTRTPPPPPRRSPPRPPPRPQRRTVDESRINEELKGYQRAYLLLQLFLAPGHTLTQKAANDKLTDAIQKRLSLTKTLANQRRQALAEQGYVRVGRSGRS